MGWKPSTAERDRSVCCVRVPGRQMALQKTASSSKRGKDCGVNGPRVCGTGLPVYGFLNPPGAEGRVLNPWRPDVSAHVVPHMARQAGGFVQKPFRCAWPSQSRAIRQDTVKFRNKNLSKPRKPGSVRNAMGRMPEVPSFSLCPPILLSGSRGCVQSAQRKTSHAVHFSGQLHTDPPGCGRLRSRDIAC